MPLILTCPHCTANCEVPEVIRAMLNDGHRHISQCECGRIVIVKETGAEKMPVDEEFAILTQHEERMALQRALLEMTGIESTSILVTNFPNRRRSE